MATTGATAFGSAVAGATAGLDLTDSTVVDSTAVLPELLGIYLDHVGAPGQYEATWAATGPTDVQVSQLPVLLSSSGSYTWLPAWAIDLGFFHRPVLLTIGI